MKKIASLITFAVCVNAFSAPSEDLLWQDVQDDIETAQQVRSASFDKNVIKKRSLNLNVNGLKQKLFASEEIKTARSGSANTSQKELDLPLPNGDYVRVYVIESPMISAELAASHPEIKTWKVVGVDDPAITGRIDFTSNGFHGMLVLASGETIYIDPDKKDGSTENYSSLSKLDNSTHFDNHFNCEIHDSHAPVSTRSFAKSNKLEKIPAPELITYDLAVAGTAEYTSTLGGKTSAYSSMVTTINRVNQIYERDLGVKLNLVTDESLLYMNSATDPYTNNSTSSLLAENMANIDSTVGSSNYDLGHVFADGVNGGLAYVGVACLNQANVGGNVVSGIKAGGASGFYSPEGETFSVDLVAHEIGHQLGANHTFNGVGGYCNGNINTETAVEPGGGNTIMSYSGNCGTDSYQFSPDAMFHWTSISEINEYTRNDIDGSSCGLRTSTGNQAPVADAGDDHVIPVNTPFLLDGEEVSGGATYSWDQVDTGTASQLDVDLGDNPIIRTLYPSSNPDRYIPRLSDLFTAGNTEGEILPQTVRNLNFSFVVRDNNGEVANDLNLISTEDTGNTFQVTSHVADETIQTSQSTNVTWRVASTTSAPINCSKVDIQLLRVDGVRNDLLMDTDNDGAETFVLPSSTPAMTDARIMVSCTTQPFFQISSGNITIQKVVDTTPPAITINGSSSVTAIEGSVYVDEGATAVDDVDGTVSVTSVSTVNTSVLGSYTVTYTAVDVAGNTSTEVRSVTVIADTVAPVISISGQSNLEVVQGSTFSDQGATAVDNLDGTVSVFDVSTVDISVLGTYTVTYTAVDAAGNTSTEVRTVTVVADTIAPVITLFGQSTIEVIQGSSYVERGASAFDNLDGYVSVSSTGSVNTSILGAHSITYTSVDNAGNISTPVTRTVNVVADTVGPTIILNGLNVVNLVEGQTYIEEGATATDNSDTNVSVTISGSVNTSVADVYTVTYSAVDSAGNTATPVTRTVNVIADTVAPVITLFGADTITITKDDTYLDSGASATDNIDTSVTVTTSGTVDTSIVGTYIVTYSATDNAGNTSTRDRSVIVVDDVQEKTPGGSSGGGSGGLLLLPLALLGLRRRFGKI